MLYFISIMDGKDIINIRYSINGTLKEYWFRRRNGSEFKLYNNIGEYFYHKVNDLWF
jgi:hypothetical protein